MSRTSLATWLSSRISCSSTLVTEPDSIYSTCQLEMGCSPNALQRGGGGGVTVTCGDINAERPEYVFVNMEMPLPFEDSSFDVVICLEGVEHVVEPYSLIKEICRVLRPDGIVVLSLPNVQSLYSRLKFLFTGTFYQFEPEGQLHPLGRLIDRGHISPLSLVQLEYIFGEFGLAPQIVTGDRIKRKILFPLYLVLWASNVLLLRFRAIRCTQEDNKRLYGFLTHLRPMLSRSLVTVWGNAKNGVS